jgi:hypothetical protein
MAIFMFIVPLLPALSRDHRCPGVQFQERAQKHERIKDEGVIGLRTARNRVNVKITDCAAVVS